mmetsp:Transcript_26980/g.57808  ORF Transcript_26980/g.57808 Transcript_26980/m.57808 type:complete len:861 (+) Transcript_26980:33-2615(+)
MTMAVNMMKAATIFTVLFSLHPTQANRSSFHRRGLFNQPRWGSQRATIRSKNTALVLFPRGGDDGDDSVVADVADPTTDTTQEPSLDDRVNEAMQRLGLVGDDSATESGSVNESSPPQPPVEVEVEVEETDMDCEGGVCTIDENDDTNIVDESADVDENDDTNTADEIADVDNSATVDDSAEVENSATVDDSTDVDEMEPAPTTQEDIVAIAERISTEMSVPQDIVMAAIYSSFSGTGDNIQIDEEAARSIIKAEVDATASVPEDCAEVAQLVEEGFDAFFVRRSLAFSEMNVDNARAILVADREDEEAEQREMEAAQAEYEAAAAAQNEPEMKTVTVDFPKDFDPVAAKQQKKPEEAPPPAKKDDVIFEGTIENLQKLVMESPVPVLLDVYADWCGPCKQLTPALEQICINAGGMLRLVKINTDQQRQISGALEVKSLPTIFGIRDGKILNSFQGMPRDEQMVRNFLMGLMVPGQKFNPPVSDEDKKGYDDLSGKLLKLAAGASFSFSARERLQVHVGKLLDQLVESIGGETGMAVADDSARVLRSLMSNVIVNPFDEKFRKINLDNKVIAAKIGQHRPCLAILKSIGFVNDGDSTLVIAKGKRIVNVAPFVVGRDCIDKWIDRNRYQIAAAGRKRKDEMGRIRLAAEAEEAAKNPVDVEEEEEESEDEVDDNLCVLKLRLEGKKKVHDVEMDADDTLSTLLEKLPFPVDDGETVQLTCVAKRLIVKSTETDKISKTLSQLRLMPTASIVVKIGEGKKADAAKGSLAERAASKKKQATGTHSMHSIGLYAQDDGKKANTFESGGVLYEHVLTDDEDEDMEGGEVEEEAADIEEEEAGENEEEADDDSEEQLEEDEQMCS